MTLQVQDKFRLDLSDEEAVHYMQSLIDESVHALFAAVVEQIHKFAQVGPQRAAFLPAPPRAAPESSESPLSPANWTFSRFFCWWWCFCLLVLGQAFLTSHQPADVNVPCTMSSKIFPLHCLSGT